MRYPKVIQNLIDQFTSLPSVGPKMAERYVFYLLNKPKKNIKELINALNNLQSEIKVCKICGALNEESPCSICKDKSRNNGLLCIVENTQDYLAIEAIKQYNGQYFILGGLLNTIENVKPQDLRIKELIARLRNNKIKEVILALNFTIEGETTALYLNQLLKNYETSRLAKGMPAGSNLEYADINTLASSFNNRNPLK